MPAYSLGKQCVVCLNTFTINRPSRQEQRYCSRRCSISEQSKRRRKRRIFQCEVCAKEFEGHAYRVAKYCSRECWAKRNPPDEKDCPICGESFKSWDRGQRTCSRKCHGQWRSQNLTGELSPQWKDGRSLERQRGRLSSDLKIWRKAVFERDAYTCQDCGAKGSLQAHHIKPFASFPELALDVNNGKTLCIECHGKAHGVDFEAQKTRTCPECGGRTKGRGKQGRCKPCAMKIMHTNRAAQRSLLSAL